MRAKKNQGGWTPVFIVGGIILALFATFAGWQKWMDKKDAGKAQQVENTRQEWIQEKRDSAASHRKMADLLGRSADGDEEATKKLLDMKIDEARKKLDSATTESEKLIAKRELEKLLEKSDR